MKHHKKTFAFTLIELLVVIGIIAILAAILLPAIKSAIDKAHKAQAQHEVAGLANAIKAYYNEYSKYPSPVGQNLTADTTIGGPGQDNSQFIKVLIADSSAAANNPRNIAFLELSSSSTNSAGSMVDPWDNAYGISLDYNFDNKLDNTPYGTISGRGVAIWSAGPDGSVNTADDLKSW